MKLAPTAYYLISAGSKTVEMRLNDEKRAKVSIGDVIEFANTETNQKIRCSVTNITHYRDFYELYSAFSKHQLGYRDNEVANAADMYAYYSQSLIDKYGVLAIEIALDNI